MLVETNIRYRAYQKAIRLSELIARKLLAIESRNMLDNIQSEVDGDLLRSSIHKSKAEHFSIFHRGTKADLGVIKQIFINEDYDISVFPQRDWVNRSYQSILEKNMIPAIVDAGSNIGLGGLYLKQNYPTSRLIAVEPASSNLKVLKKNLVNPQDRILQGAIHAGAESIELLDPGEGEWGFSTHTSDAKKGAPMETVRCYRFTDLIESGEVPFILKVDIEGGEKDQFTETEFLSRFTLIIIELHDWLYPSDRTSSSFLKFAAAANFDFCNRGENIFLFNRRFCIA